MDEDGSVGSTERLKSVMRRPAVQLQLLVVACRCLSLLVVACRCFNARLLSCELLTAVSAALAVCQSMHRITGNLASSKLVWVVGSGESPLCEPGTRFARHSFSSALPLYPSVLPPLPSLLIADNNNNDDNDGD